MKKLKTLKKHIVLLPIEVPKGKYCQNENKEGYCDKRGTAVGSFLSEHYYCELFDVYLDEDDNGVLKDHKCLMLKKS